MLSRPRLQRRIVERRVRVVDGQGFGKGALVAEWAEQQSILVSLTPMHRFVGSLARALMDRFRLQVPALGSALSSALSGLADQTPDPGALAAQVATLLEEHLVRDLALVLDNIDELAGSDAAVLVDELVTSAAASARRSLAGRGEPLRLSRLRVAGEVDDIGAADLALTADETREFLVRELGEAGARWAERVQTATGGWPVAVRLMCETIRGAAAEDAARLLEPLRRPAGPCSLYLAEEVASEGPEARRVLGTPRSWAGWMLSCAASSAPSRPSAATQRCSTCSVAAGCTSTRARGPLVHSRRCWPITWPDQQPGEDERRAALVAGAFACRHRRWAESLELLRRLGDPGCCRRRCSRRRPPC
ncbi:MAG: hypothetical protein R2734_13070 [Nocardioides sp.]